MTQRALVTGLTGQDGSYLAEFLLERGYQVYGLIRRSSAGPNFCNVAHIVDRIKLIEGDMTDSDSLVRAVRKTRPDEIYNLAAQSFVPMSWASPTYTFNVNLGGFVYLLQSVRNYYGGTDYPRIYQASTSEMFGNTGAVKGNKITKLSSLNKDSAMRPRSPYGVSKLAAHRIAQVYRESFGMFICSGILFNHESPRRGKMFVTRKITSEVAKIYAGKSDRFSLGDLRSRRDWGFAGDYVRAMWLMLQQDKPDDFVIGTGKTFSVEDCVTHAFESGAALTGRDLPNKWSDYVKSDEGLIRPADIYSLRANSSRAVEHLGWRPTVPFDSLIRMMMKNDLKEEGVIE